MTYPVIPRFGVTGPALRSGSALNKMVDALNDMLGNGTPQPGTFSTLSVSGAITPTGGIVQGAVGVFSTIPLGGVAYASLGTDKTVVAGTTYWASLFVPQNMTVTNINVLQGTISGTDKLIGAIYAAAGGAALATSALAGVTVTSSNTFLVLPLTATKAIVGPGLFWIGVQSNGNTDKIRTIAASTYVNVLTKSATGTFGTVPSLTVPTTFTADVGPIAYVN